jgi:hypothetical protein
MSKSPTKDLNKKNDFLSRLLKFFSSADPKPRDSAPVKTPITEIDFKPHSPDSKGDSVTGADPKPQDSVVGQADIKTTEINFKPHSPDSKGDSVTGADTKPIDLSEIPPFKQPPEPVDFKFQPLDWKNGDSVVDLVNGVQPPILSRDKLRTIGSGGQAIIILRAHNGEVVAVKSPKAREDIDSFPHEIDMHFFAQQISPRVPRIKKVFSKNSELCMELMVNGSLSSLLKSNRILPWSIRLRIALDIAEGLNDLHTHKILHGDLKSHNILLDAQLRAFISDFGSSRSEEEEKAAQKDLDNYYSTYVYTTAYQAPETVMGPNHSTAADIYSYGVVLWELATRSSSYENLDRLSVLAIVKKNQTNPIPASCPPRLKTIIQSCWHKDPGKRPSASKLIQQLTILWQESNHVLLSGNQFRLQANTQGKIKKSASTPNLKIQNVACSPRFFDHASAPTPLSNCPVKLHSQPQSQQLLQ